FYIALFIVVATGCKQTVLNKPNVTNTTPPGVVTNPVATNLNGKASITYTLPGNSDLLYVKAVYETSPGHPQEVKASHYTNTLTVVGFGDTLAHTVKLYAVNSSEVASAPVTVTVNPLTPAILLARRSLQVKATFGGFTLTCNNPTLENLAIIPLVDTTGNKKWVQTTGMDNIYSNSIIIKAAVRGQAAITREYAFVVRDRWLNYSDTLFAVLTPFFEQLLPKSAWSIYALPNDAKQASFVDATAIGIFDGNFTQPHWPNCLFTVENDPAPTTLTLNLGAAHVFSRLQINPFADLGNGNRDYYIRGSLKDFEIWGSNNPSISGAYDASWTLLTTCHVVKPSGLPMYTETPADQALAAAGWQFDFPAGLGSYQYIRIRNLRNWQGSYFMSMIQFTLWGSK
ncbi:MAG: DUF4959 domain-containing protein, partial [Sphingobacteriales bacterium]